MIVSWLSIHLACQTKSVIWTILFLGLPHHLWFVTVTFPVPQQQECEEHEDTHWLRVSPGVLEHRSPSQGVVPLCSAALLLNAPACPCDQHTDPVGTSAGGGAVEHTRSTRGAHKEHTYLTAYTQPRTEWPDALGDVSGEGNQEWIFSLGRCTRCTWTTQFLLQTNYIYFFKMSSKINFMVFENVHESA